VKVEHLPAPGTWDPIADAAVEGDGIVQLSDSVPGLEGVYIRLPSARILESLTPIIITRRLRSRISYVTLDPTIPEVDLTASLTASPGDSVRHQETC
jgi:hypothetical protein